MLRSTLGLIVASLGLAGCDNGSRGPASPPAKTTTRDTTIQTPNADINIHRQKTEHPDGTTQRQVEVERKKKQ